jgi:signal peptidase I
MNEIEETLPDPLPDPLPAPVPDSLPDPLLETPPESPPGPVEEVQPAPKNIAAEVRSFIKDLLETLGLALVLFLVINLVSVRVRVEGYSMLPTLDNNQFVLVSRLTPRFNDLERGDIIVFRPPMYPEAPWLDRVLGFPTLSTEYEDYIKRVIGLPGETVSVQSGVVSINGGRLEEPYIAEAPLYDGSWVVPEGNLFVLGDNRNASSDSHSWSFLPIDSVLGKAVLVYWPFSDWLVIPDEPAVLAAR